MADPSERLRAVLTPTPPAESNGCLSRLDLEVLATSPAGPRADPHVDACARCRSILEAVLIERRAFLTTRPRASFLARVQDRRARRADPPRFSQRLLLLLAPAMAVALAVFLVSRPPESGLLLKGGAGSFQVHSRGDGSSAPVRLESGAMVKAGEVLEFEFAAKRPGHLAIIEIDGAGKATVFSPFGGHSSRPVSPGMARLPGTVVLDAAPGPLRLVAIFSPEPFELPPLLERLSSGQSPEKAHSCADCSVETLVLQKRR